MKFSNEVNKRIFELIRSVDTSEKLGGILAIDALIDLDSGEENTTKVTRFANYLRMLLPGTEPQISVLAAKSLGHLATLSSTVTSEFVDFEMKRALEWLQASGDRNEARRHSAVLVLAELTKNAPTLIFVFVPQILDLIWLPLRDSKVSVREGAAEALRACLNLAHVRETNSRRQWSRKIFDEIQSGLKTNNSDDIHGSLLALRELFNTSKKFVEGRYSEIGEIVFKYKESKDSLIRNSVMQVIPDLARYDPGAFVSTYFDNAMQYLLGQLKKDKERQTAFISIGKVALAVGSSISPYLSAILTSIKENMSTKSRVNRQSDSPAFECISMLAIAVGPTLTKYMHELLDYMFAGGLTESLQQALVDLSVNIPPLLPLIQGIIH